MLIPFSATTAYNGLVQHYESEIGADYGYVSGNTIRLKEFTAQVNLAIDRYFAIAVQASGTWELDDSNHTGDYAVIYTTISSGRRDYSFITDENGNQILDIYKVLILPSVTATEYTELNPIDENQSENVSTISESPAVGSPSTYAKRGNAIHFDVTPNYTVARGIKILVNRSAHYFDYTDDNEYAGFPYFQEYFYLKPACTHARKKSLAIFPQLQEEILKLEGDPERGIVGLIAKAYGARKKDELDVISGESIDSV